MSNSSDCLPFLDKNEHAVLLSKTTAYEIFNLFFISPQIATAISRNTLSYVPSFANSS